MPVNVEGFTDNWAYLKSELHWLDRVLMLAVARQRKEKRETDRLAQSKADQATSHWWKGVISLEGTAAYDEHRQAGQEGDRTTYQQQIEARIRVTRRQGVVLALPALCDRLKLTVFEKNLVLMSLAPEVNRRYARLYHYLNGDDLRIKTDLPTFDLVLRLLCRSDAEWRSARLRLTSTSPLVQRELLYFLHPSDTLLSRALKLAEPLVNYLLSEQPTETALDQLLHPAFAPAPAPDWLHWSERSIDWTQLILPSPLLETLHHLKTHLQQQLVSTEKPVQPQGTIALWEGRSGMGKTTAAETLACALNLPLCRVDLAEVEPSDYAALLDWLTVEAPIVLLIQAAHLWLGRSAAVSEASLHRWLTQRRSQATLTLFSPAFGASVRAKWQQQMDLRLHFPQPQQDDRLRLWQQALPAEVSPSLHWQNLAKLSLSGGEIYRIAAGAVIEAAGTPIEMVHIAKSLARLGQKVPRSLVETLPQKQKRKRNS